MSVLQENADIPQSALVRGNVRRDFTEDLEGVWTSLNWKETQCRTSRCGKKNYNKMVKLSKGNRSIGNRSEGAWWVSRKDEQSNMDRKELFPLLQRGDNPLSGTRWTRLSALHSSAAVVSAAPKKEFQILSTDSCSSDNQFRGLSTAFPKHSVSVGKCWAISEIVVS